MTITEIPTKSSGSLGDALTNIRTPKINELSAVHLERIKDWVILLAQELGLSDGSQAGTINKRVTDLEAGGGGGWVHIAQDYGLVTIENAQTLITGAVADVPLILDLPDPVEAEGWVVFVRKTVGSDGAGIYLRFNDPGVDTIEGSAEAGLAEEEAGDPEDLDQVQEGDWLIPGSGAVAGDFAASDGPAPLMTWAIYSAGAGGWRFGPGTWARVMDVGSDLEDFTTKDLVGRGSVSTDYYQDGTSGAVKTTRLWMCGHATGTGSRWHALSHVRVRSVTSDTTLNHFDEVVMVDTSAGDVTLTLPDNHYSGSPGSGYNFTGNNEGRQILVVKTTDDTNLISLARPDLSTKYPAGAFPTPTVLMNGVDENPELPGSGEPTLGLRWHLFGDNNGDWWY